MEASCLGGEWSLEPFQRRPGRVLGCHAADRYPSESEVDVKENDNKYEERGFKEARGWWGPGPHATASMEGHRTSPARATGPGGGRRDPSRIVLAGRERGGRGCSTRGFGPEVAPSVFRPVARRALPSVACCGVGALQAGWVNGGAWRAGVERKREKELTCDI
ncbi:hypothetical protein Naga_100005g100 [Nannochloropsis gaditana]|uniref:Uncharacterized protein n=1 Tax=Nannochloropsis gaditana TaxID=72520 RepID=W7THB9_9STRA|nr:hypothetical protein Naga_100005g100 [Nannochloropsis gaditana]